MGLSVAVLHLTETGSGGKVVVLLTDGDNNAGEITPATASSLAARTGVKVYAIGIGTVGEVPLEWTDPDTGKVLRGTLTGRFNEEILRDIADATGGGFYTATSPGTLETIFQSIDSLETVEKQVQRRTRLVPLHRYFLGAGLAALALAFLLRKVVLEELL